MRYIQTNHLNGQLSKHLTSRRRIDEYVEFGKFSDVTECATAHDAETVDVLRQIRVMLQCQRDIGKRTGGEQNQTPFGFDCFLVDHIPCRLGVRLN